VKRSEENTIRYSVNYTLERDGVQILTILHLALFARDCASDARKGTNAIQLTTVTQKTW